MYTIESLNKLQASLEATNVLSKEYKTTIMSWALSAVNEAVKQEREKDKD